MSTATVLFPCSLYTAVIEFIQEDVQRQRGERGARLSSLKLAVSTTATSKAEVRVGPMVCRHLSRKLWVYHTLVCPSTTTTQQDLQTVEGAIKHVRALRLQRLRGLSRWDPRSSYMCCVHMARISTEETIECDEPMPPAEVLPGEAAPLPRITQAALSPIIELNWEQRLLLGK